MLEEEFIMMGSGMKKLSIKLINRTYFEYRTYSDTTISSAGYFIARTLLIIKKYKMEF